MELSTVTLRTGLTVSYAEQGDRAGPVLVLLPGPTDSWRSYEPIFEQLPPSIRAIAVSQRGHGESDKPLTGYRVEDFAADVVPLIDALGIERAVLAGHSGSCLVVRRVAIDRPERVAGLVLEASPTTLRGDAGLERFVESIVSGLEDPIDPDFARSFVVDTSSDKVGPEVRDQLVGELLKVPARVWREMLAGLLQYDDMSELGRINAPTLLVWGDADALVAGNMQDQLAERIPGAELLAYRGVRHTPDGKIRRASLPTWPPSRNDCSILDLESQSLAGVRGGGSSDLSDHRVTLVKRRDREEYENMNLAEASVGLPTAH